MSYISECIRKKVEASDNLNHDPTNLRLQSVSFSTKYAVALELRNVSRRSLERAIEEQIQNPHDDVADRVLSRARAMHLRAEELAATAGVEAAAADLAFFKE